MGGERERQRRTALAKGPGTYPPGTLLYEGREDTATAAGWKPAPRREEGWEAARWRAGSWAL